MSFHRTILVTCSALFVTALTSATYAQCGGCGGWGFSAPVAYAPLYSGGCGGCGAVAVQPVVEVQPIAVQPVVEVQLVPIAAAPIAVGCGGCGGCGGCSSTFAYQPVVASPYYVVNQGPAYTGPGVMVPFGTYAPGAGLSNPAAYPYIGGPGYGYGPRHGYGPSYGYGPRYGYGARYGYGNPYRRPYGWRG